MAEPEKKEAPGEGHNIGGERLKSYIERVERLTEEKKAIDEDIRDVYSEAKAVGFEPKIMRKLVALRKKNADVRREEQELLEMYASAIQMDLF